MGFNRSVLVIATALTYLGMTGEQALGHLRECRPGALFNENFAAHVLGLPAAPSSTRTSRRTSSSCPRDGSASRACSHGQPLAGWP